jgi:hypothetical protein
MTDGMKLSPKHECPRRKTPQQFVFRFTVMIAYLGQDHVKNIRYALDATGISDYSSGTTCMLLIVDVKCDDAFSTESHSRHTRGNKMVHEVGNSAISDCLPPAERQSRTETTLNLHKQMTIWAVKMESFALQPTLKIRK